MLRGPDLRAVLELSGTLADATGAADLRAVLFALPDVIGADWLLDARMESRRGTLTGMRAEVSDPTLDQATMGEVVGRWWRQHPVIARHVREPTLDTTMVTDFVTEAQWRRNVVFNEAYRVVGVTYDLSIQFAWAPGRTGCAALHRGGAPFSERDRAMLRALAPHLRAAYARVEQHAALRERAALLEEGIETDGRGVVRVDDDGRVLAVSPAAQRHLRTWFGAREPADRLPAELADWWAAARRRTPPGRLLRARAGRRLRVTMVAGRAEDVLILREDVDGPLSADALVSVLPLGRREAEVLALLASGMTNVAIAHELGLSPRTVGHHLEHVFAKLGTPNRAAATAAAIAAVRGAG